MTHTSSRGIIFAVLSSAFSSLAWLTQGEAVLVLGPLLTATSLGLLGSTILFIFLGLRRELPRLGLLPQLRKDFIIVVFVRSVFGSIVFSYSLLLTSGMKLMFFTKLEPYFVLFFSWLLLRYPIRAWQLALLAIHLFGAWILSTNGQLTFDQAHLGDLMVVAAVGVISLSYAPAARLSKALGPVQANAMIMLCGGLIVLPFALLVTPTAPWNLALQGWKYLLITVLIFHVFGLSLWYSSLRTVEGWIVSALRAVGPVVAAPVGFLFFGQTLTALQISGALLVLITSALVAMEGHRKEEGV